MIFGPPGSGKGTYSSMLRGKFHIDKISTGDIFREEIAKKSELGALVEPYVVKGELVPDDLVNEVVKKRIENSKNFILDGYPRTKSQAEFLFTVTNIDALIEIKVHDEVLMEKISGRRICSNPKCDGNYNIVEVSREIEGVRYFLPKMMPKSDMVCDKCGSPLIQREDDKPEKVAVRLEIYRKRSEPVLSFMKKRVESVQIWMNRPAKEVFSELVEKLRRLPSFDLVEKV